jgi:hypothetical protein
MILNTFIVLISLYLIFKYYSKLELFNNPGFKIVIGGCCRNCENFLPKILKKIKDITKLCSDYQIIIYENDSKDNSLQLLNNFKNVNKNVTIISEKNIVKKFKKRAHRLAYARNKILEEIYKKNYDSKYEYFINLDLDDINVNMDVNSIKTFLKSDLDWDVGTANNKKYYDLWALRTEKYNYNCWNNGSCSKNKKHLGEWFDQFSKTSIEKNEKPIKVLSAFGGLGIYKIKSIKNCKYDGVEKKKSYNGIIEDCEHVKFHECMRNNGNDNIYIIPYLNNI